MSVKVVADWIRSRRGDVAVKWGAGVCPSGVPGVHWPGSLSVLALELTKTHCLLNGVLDVSLGFIVLPLVHALCSRWAGSELALLKGYCI